MEKYTPSKGILFNQGSVLGIENCVPGTFPVRPLNPSRMVKSQTRRVVRLPSAYPAWTYQHIDRKATKAERGCAVILRRGDETRRIRCPYGGPGTVLWIREAFGAPPVGIDRDEEEPRIPEDVEVIYRAARQPLPLGWRWLPGKFLPRHHARLWIRLEHVRVEPLQNITEEEARLEAPERHTRLLPFMEAEREYFHRKWDEVNADRGFPWVSNPWVWVLSFRRVGLDP